MRNKVLISLLTILLMNIASPAQDVETLLGQARQSEQAFNDQEALQRYQQVLKIQPNHLQALCKVSELYSLLGKRQAKKEDQNKYFRQAKTVAQQALQVNPQSPDANFVMALAMGRMAIISSGEEKIKAVKDIKSYAEKCIQLDPRNYKGYHILGRWHYEVSDLSSIEKWLVKVAYGALPPATLKDAMTFYEKSRQLNPGLSINYLELAKCYHRNDEDEKAVQMLKTLLTLPNTMIDDPIVKQEATGLLKKWE